MQSQAKEAVYWPGIDADITDYIKRCLICIKHKSYQLALPMLPQDIPNGQWQEFTANYINHKGKDYLPLKGHFQVCPFPHPKNIVTHYPIQTHLSRVYTDNGSPSTSEKFEKFLQWQHTKHITSSTHFPQSNCFIEWQVKMFKTALSTSQDTRTPLKKLLLNLWPTPISPRMPSPGEILPNRTVHHPGRPSMPNDMEAVWNHLISKKQMQKQYFNTSNNVEPLSQLKPDQEILFLSPVDQR